MIVLSRRAALLCAGALVAGCVSGRTAAKPEKRSYAISTNHPLASKAAEAIRRSGGGVYDMMIAAVAASWVVDPANSSPFGRIQGVNASSDRVDTMQAATMIRDVPGSTVPIPGTIAAIRLCAQSGRLRLPLTKVLAPAVAIARQGHAPSAAFRDILRTTADALDTSLRNLYLDANGTSLPIVRNPALADLIETLGNAANNAAFWTALSERHSLPWAAQELASNEARFGHSLAAPIGSIGTLHTTSIIETWGPWTMLGISVLDRLKKSGAMTNAPRAVEAFAIAMILLLDRIPFRVGTLEPKMENPIIPSDPQSEADVIARRTVALLDGPPRMMWEAIGATAYGTDAARTDDRNTTHFSVADDTDMLAWTTSIGPWFGSRQGVSGAALGYSYAMQSGQRYRDQTHDGTELSPIIAIDGGKPVLAIGAAGSERILGALCWLFFKRLRSAGSASFSSLIRSPRLFPKDGKLRVHEDMPRPVQDHLIARGFALQRVAYDVTRHLGIVGLVERDTYGALLGASDPSSSGLAL